MDRKSLLIAALAATLGAGVTLSVTGTSAAPAITIDTVRLFKAQIPDAGVGYAVEVCGRADLAPLPADDAGVVVVPIFEQGCISEPVPRAAQARADDFFNAAQALWKQRKSVP